MGLCLICCFIFLIISIIYFTYVVTDNWGELITEDILKAVSSLAFFILSIVGAVGGINYKVKTDLKIEEYENKMKIVEPIIETNKIIVDGKEYEGKIIDKNFSNFIQLKTKEETLIIVEPKSITTKN